MKTVRATPLFDILTDLPELREEKQIDRVAARIRDQYDLKSVAYLGAGLKPERGAEPYLAVTYSAAWVDHYKRQRYVEIDPVVQLGLRRILPLDWEDVDRQGIRLRTFFGEAGEFGLGKRGLSIPVHGRQGDRALLSITSDLPKREWAREKRHLMRDFQLLATHLHEALPGRRTRSRLCRHASANAWNGSPRERRPGNVR
ncbi:autoinducer binding domain-containing protein [Mesorhizobium sp. BHbdii]